MASARWGLRDRCIVGEVILTWGVSELSLPVCFLWHLAGCHLICYRSSGLFCRPRSGERPTLQFSVRKIRASSSQVKSSATQRSHISQARCGLCEAEQLIRKCDMFASLSVCLFKHHKMDRWTQREGERREQGEDGSSWAQTARRFIVKPTVTGINTIQHIFSPLAWLKRGMDDGQELSNLTLWIIRG